MRVLPILLLLSISAPSVAQMTLSPDALLPNGSISKNSLEAVHKAFESGQSMTVFTETGMLIQGQDVRIKVVAASEDSSGLLSDLTVLGLKDARVLGHAIYGDLPIRSIPAVMELAGIKSIHPEDRGQTNASLSCISQSFVFRNLVPNRPGCNEEIANPNTGNDQDTNDNSDTGEDSDTGNTADIATDFNAGDRSLNADRARNTFGATGANITIGVISSSYNCFQTAQSDVQAGLLPDDVVVLQEATCSFLESTFPSAIDEGRAMMQLINRIAPDADLVFHSAGGINGNFVPELVDAINNLTRAGVDIIVDDVLATGSPFFQDGFVSQAVDDAEAAGVAYFTAAGNSGRNAWGSPFRDSGLIGFEGGKLHDFDPSAGVDVVNSFDVPVGGSIGFILEWDQPFFSVSGRGGSRSNVDVVIFDSSNNPILFIDDDNVGGDPRQRFFINNTGDLDFNNDGVPDTRFGFGFQLTQGVEPGRLKLVAFPSSGVPGITQIERPRISSPMSGQQLARGSFTVGASRYTNTPRFGQDPARIEFISSVGGTVRVFDRNGRSIQEQRQKPQAVGPTGVNTSFFGTLGTADLESDGLPNFFGTSAAAPQVAAVAALMLSVNPELSPRDIRTLLTETSADMDDPRTTGFDRGFDFTTGFGYVNAVNALSAINVQPPAETPSTNTPPASTPPPSTTPTFTFPTFTFPTFNFGNR